MMLPVADPRPRPLRRVHADRALGDARDARRGLRAHRAREGPANRGRSCASTRCATRCCRSTTLIALSLGYIVAGAILIETVFSWPGHRPRRLRGGAPARLPDAAGRVPHPDGVGRLLQPRRRPPLLQARPEDHANERRPRTSPAPSTRRRRRPAATSRRRLAARCAGRPRRIGRRRAVSSLIVV